MDRRARAASPRSEAGCSAWGPTFTEWTDSDHRRHRILDALFKAAERHGLAAKTGDRRETYFAFGQERID